MKMLFTSVCAPEVGLLKNLLDEAGIACEVRNENTFSNFPTADMSPELWVLNDDVFFRACELREAFTKAASVSQKSWTCACGEKLEAQFNSCWKCGASRPNF
jgi:hypothetical protein